MPASSGGAGAAGATADTPVEGAQAVDAERVARDAGSVDRRT